MTSYLSDRTLEDETKITGDEIASGTEWPSACNLSATPMKTPRKLVVGGIVAGLIAAIIIGLLVGGSVLTKRFEPYIREQAVSWLEKRFDSRVELASHE